MNGAVVVDASLAFKWLVEELYSERAVTMVHTWAQEGLQLTAPYIMPVEVANALHRKVVRQELSEDTATFLLDRLMVVGVALREPQKLHIRALELAAVLRQQAVYDSHYLALAEIMDCDFWTADERFYRAVTPRFPRVRWIGEG